MKKKKRKRNGKYIYKNKISNNRQITSNNIKFVYIYIYIYLR